MFEQSVDSQTVDRLHVSDAVAGDVLNAHSKGQNSIVGLISTAGSTVECSVADSERQFKLRVKDCGHLKIL